MVLASLKPGKQENTFALQKQNKTPNLICTRGVCQFALHAPPGGGARAQPPPFGFLAQSVFWVGAPL